MELTTLWFIIIAVLWAGYLVLEGFDFGVGMHMGLLARGDRERRVLLNTIGPVWDGNEVWLIVAAGAMFAAFPEWYATMFSGFYLLLFVILVALIVRAVAIEYRHKRPEQEWKRTADRAIIGGSVTCAFLWGVALASIVRGVPLDGDHEFAGSIVDLVHPYALLGGAVTVSLFAAHGAFFIGLKTVGDIRERARVVGLRWGAGALVLTALFIGWTASRDGDTVVWAVGAVAVVAFVGALAAAGAGREGFAFAGTVLTIAAVVTMLFTALFPDVMVSTLDPAGTLTVTNAASSPYTLTILSWVALAFAPIVVGYQAWSYWVFRKRIGTHHLPA